MGMKQVLFGVGVGAIVGLLCAPKKGSELREDIKENGKKVIEKTKNLTKEDVIELLNTSYNAAVDYVKNFDTEATKAKLSELKVSVDELKNKIKDNENISELINKITKVTENATTKINEYKKSLNNEELEEVIQDIIEEETEEIEDIIEELNEENTEE